MHNGHYAVCIVWISMETKNGKPIALNSHYAVCIVWISIRGNNNPVHVMLWSLCCMHSVDFNIMPTST